jgi:hypothetical protein
VKCAPDFRYAGRIAIERRRRDHSDPLLHELSY